MDEPIYDLFEREVWRDLAGLEVMHVDGKAIGNRIIAAHKADRLTLRKALEEAIGDPEDFDAPVQVLSGGETPDLVRHDRIVRNIMREQLLSEIARIMGETSRDANNSSESQ